MILGTGIDIVNMERIAHLITRWGDLFLSRVFTPNEIARCRDRANSSECFAVRFAAKEAFLKAVGTGFDKGIHWKDIEVANDSSGKPFLLFYRTALEWTRTLGVRRSFLTLSHDRPYAVAHVLLEGGDDESCHG
jgi:holo-[acyl-carrier protein] synthase